MVGLVGRRGLLPLLALALVATTASAAPPTPPEAATAPPPVDCTAVAQTDQQAAEIARACDKDVEVVGERTSWQTLYAQADGNMRLETSTAAVRTQLDGEWVAVDNDVVAGADGLTVAAAVTPMTFSDGSEGAPLATIERDGHTLTFDVPFDLPAPTVDGDQVVYADVLPDVDLVVTVSPDATGFSEVLRIANPKAAAHPQLDELRFPVTTSTGLDVVAHGGGFEARDRKGESVFLSPTPTMWDSTVAPAATPAPRLRSGARQQQAEEAPARREGLSAGLNVDRSVAPVGVEKVAPMALEVEDDAITVVPDEGLLTDPATVWPVYVDPGISGSLQQYAAVRTVFGTKTGWSDEGVGLCHRPTSTTCSQTFSSRLLYRFVGLDTIGALDPGNIIAATFAAVGTHSYNCTAQPIELYRVNDFNSSTVGWDGGFLVHQSTAVVAHKDSCAGQPVRWIEFNALEAAQAVAGANTTALALGLHANEGSMAYWKRYRWDAGFSVVFNRPPNPAYGLRTDNPSTTCVVGANRPFIRSLSPILVASGSDPDGDGVWMRFDTVDIATQQRTWYVDTGGQGSGSQFAAVAGGLQNGRSYHWRAFPFDTSYGWGGPGAACEFTVDTSPPTPPTVTPVEGQPAVYREGEFAGGLGQTGQFTLAPNGTTDVVQYRYAFNADPALGTTVPVALGASTTITYTPSDSAGGKVLRVQSIDRAGNVSTTKEYAFIVKFPGTWRLDEGNGTSAAGQGTSGSRYPLTVSSSTTWVDGLLTEAQFSTTDKALKFDQSTDVASTAGPVVATNVPYTVMAFVRADAATGTTTAVSQDGSQASQFELGKVQDAACPAATGGTCWAFSVRPTDATSAVPVRALSAVPVTAGEWYHLAGIRTTTGVQLSVCRLGTAANLVEAPEPVVTGESALGSTFNATGVMRVGRATDGTAAARSWLGTVDNVQVMDGPASTAKLRISCSQVE